jgi:hypothetical protein
VGYQNVPSLQVSGGLHDSLVKEDKHSPLALLLRHKPTEADSADIVPHLDAVSDLAVTAGRDFLHRVGGAVVGLCVCIVKHTHHKRVLATLIPLTQENSAQCLAEESLTLNRDGVCCPPSARLTPESVAGGEGGT